MKTFVITSYTNYGQVIDIVNANNLEEANNIANQDKTIWKGFDIEELDTTTLGNVFTGGGDY